MIDARIGDASVTLRVFHRWVIQQAIYLIDSNKSLIKSHFNKDKQINKQGKDT